jgi:hypothetical protein
MTIKATVVDTNAKTIVKNAVGMVIRVRDSVLLDFKRTDKMGQFNFTVPIDTVEFIIKHPEYGDYRSYIFGSKENNVFEMNPLAMPELSSEIEEVVIFAYKDPIYYRGDTLVYVADSFKVKENAVVEDLLKKLPGMSVDANGKITNQGKEIGQVLVDGDEFFGKYGYKCPTGVKGRNSDNKLYNEKIGWSVSEPLINGLTKTYEWINKNIKTN